MAEEAGAPGPSAADEDDHEAIQDELRELSFHPMLVRPVPTLQGGRRHRDHAELWRSSARPSHPAEDRPDLTTEGEYKLVSHVIDDDGDVMA